MDLDFFGLWRRQAAFAGGFAALGPFAGYVMTSRLTQMAMEGHTPSAAGQAEANRMVSEKMSALAEGAFAAGRVLSNLPMAFGPVAAANTIMQAAEASMRPADRVVRANARRLSRPAR